MPVTGDDGGPPGHESGGVTPASASAHAFVSDLDDPVLAGADHHHLAHVLRLPAGAEVTISDGHGRWRPGRLTAGPTVEATGPVVMDPEPCPAITVAFALIKGGRPELTVQKLTEAGVDRIVPFVAERSVVRWEPAKADRHVSRLATVAREAAMQCRRVRLPPIARLASFAEVAALPGATLADMDGGPPSLERPTILIGPEGGWSSSERAAGLPRTRLGIHVFRAETAAITAGAIFVALRENLLGYGS